jgi:hypothetical protein
MKRIEGIDTESRAEWPDPLRCTGRTTLQMLAAPQDAVFISCHAGSVRHDRDLAAKHGRRDLKVFAPTWLIDHRWEGREFTGIVVDHDAKLTERERHSLNIALTRVR